MAVWRAGICSLREKKKPERLLTQSFLTKEQIGDGWWTIPQTATCSIEQDLVVGGAERG